eukprot:6492531-Amphidinium_carterae.2
MSDECISKEVEFLEFWVTRVMISFSIVGVSICGVAVLVAVLSTRVGWQKHCGASRKALSSLLLRAMGTRRIAKASEQLPPAKRPKGAVLVCECCQKRSSHTEWAEYDEKDGARGAPKGAACQECAHMHHTAFRYLSFGEFVKLLQTEEQGFIL